MEKRHIGKMIKLLREKKDITQDEFATEIGYSQRAISKWELNPMGAPIPVLHKIAEFFGTDISVFFPSDQQIPLEYQEFITLLSQVPEETRIKLLESYKFQTSVLVEKQNKGGTDE